MTYIRLASQIYNNSPTPYLSRVTVHLRSIHHQTPLVAPGPAHEPLPQDALDAEVDDLRDVEPAAVGQQVPDEAGRGPGEEALVGELQVVEVDGLLAGAEVDVAEDVQAGADAPDLAEEMGAAEAEVEVVLLFWESYMTRSQPGGLGGGERERGETYRWGVGDEDVGMERDLAQPGLCVWRVLKAVCSVRIRRKLVGAN